MKLTKQLACASVLLIAGLTGCAPVVDGEQDCLTDDCVDTIPSEVPNDRVGPKAVWVTVDNTSESEITVNGEACEALCRIRLPRGTPVTLEADASGGVQFIGWAVAIDSVEWAGNCETDTMCDFTAEQDVRIDALFEPASAPQEAE